MKLITYHLGSDGPRPGALSPDHAHVIDLGEIAADVLGLLEGGEPAMDAARNHLAHAPPETWRPLDEVMLDSPVPRPASIRDTMTFEAHIINCIRLRLGPLARLDERLGTIVGDRRTLAGRLNRSFYERPPYYKSNPGR